MQPVISRIASTTNGLALSWSAENTNAAYTVQFRSSLTSGAWQNASMRYRWPSPLPHWTDAPMTVRAPRFYRVIAETPPDPIRGRLLTNSTVGQLSTNQVRSVMLDLGASGFVSPRLLNVIEVLFWQCPARLSGWRALVVNCVSIEARLV